MNQDQNQMYQNPKPGRYSNYAYDMFMDMMDKWLEERTKRPTLQQNYQYADVDEEYNRQKEMLVDNYKDRRELQNRNPDSVQAQRQIFRDEFFNKGLSPSMQYTEADRLDILEGNKKKNKQKMEMDEMMKLKEKREPQFFGDLFVEGQGMNKKQYKQMVVNELKKLKTMKAGKMEDDENCEKKVKRKRTYKGNKWIEHVKKAANILGIPYTEALLDKRVKATYKG